MIKSYVGNTYNSLTVVARIPEKDYKYHRMMLCVCVCGKNHEAFIGNLKSGNTKACPTCAAKNRSRGRVKPNRDHRVRNVYHTMIARCHNPNSDSYGRYGALGVTVCDRWRESLDNFIEDMGLPKKGESIDRIKSEEGYCPENCRWATNETQANNKRNTVRHTHDGLSLTLAQWARRLKLDYGRLKNRVNVLNMPFEKAIIEGKLNRKHTYSIEGVDFDSLQVIADHYDMSLSGVYGRLKSDNYPRWHKKTE